MEASRLIFRSQSRLRFVLQNEVQSRKRRLSRSFVPSKGEVADVDIYVDEECLQGADRSFIDGFCWGYSLDYVPDVFRQIVEENRQAMTDYLGSDFTFEPPIVYRTPNLPAHLETFDVYSNVWHQDSHDGNRMLKIFVLLDDVSVDDGPLHFLPEEESKAQWASLYQRWDAAKIKKMPRFAEENLVVGARGTWQLVDTSRCMHRAGNPTETRDMAMMGFYPVWRKFHDPSRQTWT